MPYTFYNCEVTAILEEAPGVRRYFLKYPPEVEFKFKAGQFVMLDLPITTKQTRRSYSIASAPSADNIIELCIVLKPGGPGTEYIFNEVKIGSVLKSSEGIGKFTLADTIDGDICFICTGTGVAPFRSMLLDLFNHNLAHKNLYLVFGCRTEADLLYRKELEALEEQYPTFKYIPVLSRETPEGWTGASGYVHAVYESLIPKMHEPVFYICGWSAMLKEARHRLEEKGFTKQQIRFESFE